MVVARPRLGSVRRRMFAGVRARSTLFATLVVAVALVVGSALLLVLLQRALLSSVESNADSRAAEVAKRVQGSSMGAIRRDLQQNTRESQLVQVIDADGTIVASSSDRAGRRKLTTLRPAAGEVASNRTDALDFLDPDSPYVITARGVDRSGSTYTVAIASSLEAQGETIGQLSGYLLIFGPVSVVLVAFGTWLLVGRSLRPVELIRRRVDSIGSEHLSERVPVPDSHDEVSRLATTMNAMLARLQVGQQAQRGFVSDASHELRSPLATLAASLEVAGSDPSGAAWGDLKDVMAAEVVRMDRLVGDLLLLAKVDDQGLSVRHDDVDLDDLLSDEVRRLRAQGRIEVQAQISAVRVSGDRDRLSQLVRNLVENAALAADSHVRVSVMQGPGEALVTIEDDGPGVPVADRDRIFDRFVRLDLSRSRDSGGSGLGLAIVDEVARAHGGTVSVDGSTLGGARFVVRLPVPTPTR